MGRIGLGYGSEWHLLSYLGKHRDELRARVLNVTGGTGVEWLDCPSELSDRRLRDREWKGIEFVERQDVRRDWRAFWPQTGNVPNWDAVGRLRIGDAEEWLLVEAKAHLGEIRSSCGAVAEGGLDQIRRALADTKSALGVDRSSDWLNGFYQYCNRLAVLEFLRARGVAARLLLIYFVGDEFMGRECPVDESGWRAAIDEQDGHVGLKADHPIRQRIHRLFLPAFVSGPRAPVDDRSKPTTEKRP